MILSFVWPSTPQYTGGVVALYEFANGLSRRGHEVHFIHGPAWPNRIEDPSELDWFPFEPTVIHHIVDSMEDPTLPEGDVVFSPWVPERLGLPCVFIQGHLMISIPMERSAFRARCPKICIASWLIDIGVEEYGVPPEQLFHVPLGLDHDLFRRATPLDQRPTDVAVLYNKHPAKGWFPGAKALELVHDRHPDLTVDVFGILPPEQPIAPWMTFHEDLDRADLTTRIYNQAKVFLQPSMYEGFGWTAIEAMASGCALVSTNNGGSCDYAVPGETALVVEPGDSEGMAEAVIALLDDDELRKRLARAGEELTRRFDWDRGSELLEGILEQYIADPSRFQREPTPRDEPDIGFAFVAGALVPLPAEPSKAMPLR